MGRKRIIGCDAVLDAAERVIQRDGAVNLTISAVAEEAGVSKATVLYDFKTKHALIGALVARQMETDDRRLQDCIEAAADAPDVANPELVGRIRFAATMPDTQDRASVMTICLAMAADDSVRMRIRDFVGKDQKAFLGDGETAAELGPLMAFLALQGYLSLTCFDFCDFSPEVRDQIFSGIGKMTRMPNALFDDL
ncbi:TetR/AcrR family transcriptional regulator [Camelimonas fluminis]|uniref:TetR/AcrR family transcriptional regulator n=1 Tax=Camelimonas fluminis TaxID=1576911 RepID=A0ABV7UFX7_9HYPH|nr:TetR/AcrR family transcriptional regulator [Camelimonas fluminis]